MKNIKVQSKLLNICFIFAMLIPILFMIICIYDITTKQLLLYQKLLRVFFISPIIYLTFLLLSMRPCTIELESDMLIFNNYINWLEIVEQVNKFHGLKIRRPERYRINLSEIEIVIYGVINEIISINEEHHNELEVIKLTEYKKAYNLALSKGYVTEHTKGHHIIRYYIYLKDKYGRIHLINLSSVPKEKINDLLIELEANSIVSINTRKFAFTN